MSNNQVCSQCGVEVSEKVLKCPQCGSQARYKTLKEAYSWSGLGLFDLIPVIRDLPYLIRFVIMAATVLALGVLINKAL